MQVARSKSFPSSVIDLERNFPDSQFMGSNPFSNTPAVPIVPRPAPDKDDEFDDRIEVMKDSVTTILKSVGEDPTRQGLLDTPERYAKAMLYFTKGYTENLTGM